MTRNGLWRVEHLQRGDWVYEFGLWTHSNLSEGKGVGDEGWSEEYEFLSELHCKRSKV